MATYPETPISLNLGIYLKSYQGSYYNLRDIPFFKGYRNPLNPIDPLKEP